MEFDGLNERLQVVDKEIFAVEQFQDSAAQARRCRAKLAMAGLFTFIKSHCRNQHQ